MAEPAPVTWTPDDTEAWLSGNALPQDFVWPHRAKLDDGRENPQPVVPSYRLTKGYGFWLRTTPYFPGLFEEIHAVLVGMGQQLPEDGADLARILNDRPLRAALKARSEKQISLPLL